MNWVWRMMLGPILWAVAFAALYALHGFGCAHYWQRITLFGSDLHQISLILGYALALVVAFGLWLWVPKGAEARLVRLGDNIGLASIALTLWPVVGLTSCF